ncbi:hypothetical protein [Streptomyces sp. 5-6(2022)]|nr:hypothetical protein [Streptomyces sp. 5-6(2022)]
MRIEERERPAARIPFVIYPLALGTFVLGATALVGTGQLPGI